MKFFKRLTKHEKLLVLADQTVFSAASFLTTLALAHLLNKQEYGLYAGIILSMYFLLSVSNAVVIQPMQVSIANMKRKRRYLAFTLYLQVGLLVLLLLAVHLLLRLPAFSNFRHFQAPSCLLVSGFILHDYFRKTFLAINKPLEALSIDVVAAIAQIMYLYILNLLGPLPFYTTLSVIASSYLPSILLSLCLQHYKKLWFSEIKDYIRLNMRQAFWLILVSVLQWSSGNFFTMASGIYLGLESLGAFRLAQSLFGILNILLQTFENYVLPKASFIQHVNPELSKKYLHTITLQGALLFFPVLLVLYIFSDSVIAFAGGSNYSQYGYVIKLMCVLYVFIYIGYPVRIGIRTLVANKSFFIGYLISFVFSLISFNYLLKHGQLIGAIIGLIINQILMITYWQYCLKQKNYTVWK